MISSYSHTVYEIQKMINAFINDLSYNLSAIIILYTCTNCYELFKHKKLNQ